LQAEVNVIDQQRLQIKASIGEASNLDTSKASGMRSGSGMARRRRLTDYIGKRGITVRISGAAM